MARFVPRIACVIGARRRDRRWSSPIRPATAVAAPLDMSAIARGRACRRRGSTPTIDYQHAIGAGTGIVLDPGGAVLTNFHVVQGADSITATVAGAAVSPPTSSATTAATTSPSCSCAAPAACPTAPLGDSSQLAVGRSRRRARQRRGTRQPADPRGGHGESASAGPINAKDELTGSSDAVTGLIEFAAPVRAGDSGGPLVNGAGQVVGMTTAATVNFRMGPGGEGFAIPINDAMAIAGQIRSRAPSDTVHIGPPTLLGVGVSRRRPGTSLPGVVIREVLRGGPAEQAGLRRR